jgi:hypothetical protein
MNATLTKLGLAAGFLGTIAIGATSPRLAKQRHVASSAEKLSYGYTCQNSWFYPGYYCYQPTAYYSSDWWSNRWYPANYAYDSYSCTTAVWDGWQWIRRRVC